MRTLALSALLALAACGPLVQIGGNDKPPAMLLTLRADTGPPAAGTDAATAKTLVVAVPMAIGALQTLRIPVTTANTELQYLTGAQWSEQPNRLFRRVIADTIAARGMVVLDPLQRVPAGARLLTGTLVEFGLDVRAAPTVRVRFDAILSTGGAQVAARRFEASATPASQTPESVAAALNQAANQVAGEVAAWVAG